MNPAFVRDRSISMGGGGGLAGAAGKVVAQKCMTHTLIGINSADPPKGIG